MDLTVFFDEFQKLSAMGGHIGAVATAVFLAVRLYRLPDIQTILPEKMRWETLPLWLKYTVLSALAAAGGAMMSLVGDHSWLDAGKAAFAALVTAISTDKITSTKVAQAVAGVLVQGVVPVASAAPVVVAPAPLPITPTQPPAP